MSQILETLLTALPTALAADMRISVNRFLNVSLRHNNAAHKPPKSLAVIIDEVVSAAQLLVDSGMWDSSDQLTQQVSTAVGGQRHVGLVRSADSTGEYSWWWTAACGTCRSNSQVGTASEKSIMQTTTC